MRFKVSVIIPVYNAEKYISSCIESLLRQTILACEFIFINDGSTDHSKQMIEKYMEFDNRIKLFNQKNQGVSAARNKGLSMASGEYIGFVDADDYIDEGMYERLYDTAQKNQSDIVIANFESERNGQKLITNYPFPVNRVLGKNYIEQDLLPYLLKAENLNTVCNKLYKYQIIKKNSIGFPEKVALGEDGMFNMWFFSRAGTMIYIDYTGYHYHEVEGSATRDIASKDYFHRALEIYKMKLPQSFLGKMEKEKIQVLKSIKFINSVMSYIHVYFSPSKGLSFSKRYRYVKNMVANKYVQESLPLYCLENYVNLGLYERLIVKMIKRKFTLGLYCAAAYSRFRNRKKR
jgi:glycosyltransferase involved in cell wall biosynthesis